MKKDQQSVLTKVQSPYSVRVKTLQKKALKGLGLRRSREIDVSKVSKDFRWDDHVLMHRSGIHLAGGFKLLCSSWTAGGHVLGADVVKPAVLCGS